MSPHNLDRPGVTSAPRLLPRLRQTLLALLVTAVAVALTSVRSAAKHAAAGDKPADSTAPATDGGGRITGTVVKEDGSPCPDARVLILRRGMIIGRPKTIETRSAADGTFAFDGVAPATYRVWAIAGNLSSRVKRFEGATVTVPKGAAAGGEDARPVKLHMRQGCTLIASVNTIDGKPIGGARVRFTWSDLGTPEFLTAADGTVTIEALSPEAWQVEATAPGKAKVIKAVNLAAAPQGAVDFALPDGGAVFGKATGPDGKPAAAVGINAYPDNTGTPTHYLTTEADGSFRIDNLPLAGDVRLYFNRDKSFEGKSETLTLTPEHRERELNVTLTPRAPGGSVAGTVVDNAGNPVAGARVTSLGSSSASRQTVTTDAAGKFRIDGIEPRSIGGPELGVQATGWAPQVVSISPGTREAPGEVAIRLTEKGHRIVGRVVDEQGKPVKGARVFAGSTGAFDLKSQNTTTDEHGRFSFDSLPDNVPFDVVAAGFSRASGLRLGLDRDDEVELVLQAGGAVAGAVVDADTGKPVPRFNVRMRSSPGAKRVGGLVSSRSDRGEDFSSPAGAFRLDDLDAGQELTLIVSADGYPAQYLDGVVVTPGAAGPPVDFKLSKQPADYARVAGRVVDVNGKPIAGVELRLVVYAPGRPEQQPRRSAGRGDFHWEMLKSGQLRIQQYVRSIEQTTAAPDGTFAFPAVPTAGGADLAYWGPGVPQTRIESVEQLTPAERERLELRTLRPATVSGRINREAYPNLPHLNVRGITDPEFQLEVPIADAKQDRYTVPALPPGTYYLHVMGEAIPSGRGTFFFPRVARVEFQVSEGETKSLDLGFDPAFAIAGVVSADGKPRPKAKVSLYLHADAARRPEIQRTTRADADGRYRFAHVPPGKYVLLVAADDDKPQPFGQPVDAATAPGRQTVEVTDADVEKDLATADPAGL